METRGNLEKLSEGKVHILTRSATYHLCQLAPRVCTPEGKGRTNRSIFQLRRLSVLTTQSRTHIGPECLDFSLIFPFTSIVVLHPFPLTASISPISTTTPSMIIATTIHRQPRHQLHFTSPCDTTINFDSAAPLGHCCNTLHLVHHITLAPPRCAG